MRKDEDLLTELQDELNDVLDRFRESFGIEETIATLEARLRLLELTLRLDPEAK
jgi:hypothetical protein